MIKFTDKNARIVEVSGDALDEEILLNLLKKVPQDEFLELPTKE